MDQNITPDIKGILRRRWKGAVLILIPVFVIAVIVAMALPPKYMSETTILVEEQQIPREYVRTTVTSYVEERLQVITQRVMSRTKLMEIIKELNLYVEMRERATTEEVIEKMREDIKLTTISADMTDKRSGRSSSGTIAFVLSYEGLNPALVQRVTNVLASLYLEENVKSRSERASNTTEFLQAEADKISKQIDEYESKIAEFKKNHIEELSSDASQSALDRLQRDIEQMTLQIRNLEERKLYLISQLSGLEESERVVSGGGGRSAARLEQLRMQLASLLANRSEKHPDVIRLRNEIAQLEGRRPSGQRSSLQSELNKLNSELNQLKGKYSDKHPDVIKKRQEIDKVSKKLAVAPAESYSSSSPVVVSEKPNPAYLALKMQVDALDLEINGLKRAQEETREKIEVYQKRLERAPIIEKEYSALVRDYGTERHRYNEIMAKLMEAKVAQEMEESHQGERFTIIEPAQRPQKPHKPNRPAIIIIGLVIAMGAGFGYAAGREALDRTIKSPDDLGRITGAPLLTVVPFLETELEKRRRKKRTIAFAAAGFATVIVGLVVLHFFIMPLDIVWIKIQKRMMLWS
jgi:succinoglycan biosynthesis transport protein ExoP